MENVSAPSALEPAAKLIGSWAELPLAVLILTLIVYNVAS